MLTHASILSLTSDGTRHRPFIEGLGSQRSFWPPSLPTAPNVDPLEPVSDSRPKSRFEIKSRLTPPMPIADRAMLEVIHSGWP